MSLADQMSREHDGPDGAWDDAEPDAEDLAEFDVTTDREPVFDPKEE